MVSLLEASTLKKPHLRLKDHVWSCSTFRLVRGWIVPPFRAWRIGYGYTPKEAYEDWSKQ